MSSGEKCSGTRWQKRTPRPSEPPHPLERYTYRVLWWDEDQEFVGLCAEFPSLSWLACSQSAALAGIVRVVREVVAEMRTQDLA